MFEKNKKSVSKLCLKLFLATVILGIGSSALASETQNYLRESESSQTSDPSKFKEPKPSAESQTEPLDFSSLGRSGQQTAGESRGSCPSVAIPLTAIAPSSNASKTIASHPQWWFYNPYNKSDIEKIEFVIQNQQRQDVLRTNLNNVTETPYLNATIPQTHSGIKTNLWYRWYLKVYCHGGDNTVPLFVSGWVKKVIPEIKDNKVSSSWTIEEYTEQNLWLDAVNLLFKNEIYQSSDIDKHQVWQQIIQSPEISLNLPFPETISIVNN